MTLYHSFDWKRGKAAFEEIASLDPRMPVWRTTRFTATTTRPLRTKGLEAAKRYFQIAPDAPHAQHMPSHIFTRVSAWRESVASNQASVAAAKRAWQPNVLATGHGRGGISRSSPPSVRSPTAHGLISPTRSRCCRSGKASHLPYPLLNDRIFASERLLQAAREMGDVPYDARIR